MRYFSDSSLRANPQGLAKQSMDCRVAMLLAMTILYGLLPLSAALANEKNDPKPSAVIAPYPAKVKTEFLTACVGLHREMIPACRCMILTFEKTTSLKDFQAIAKSAEPAENATFKHVASACLRRIQTSQ